MKAAVAYCVFFLLPAASAANLKPKRYARRLARCAEKLEDCKEILATGPELNGLFRQSVARASEDAESKVEEVLIDEEIPTGELVGVEKNRTGINPLKAIQGMFYEVAGEDGALSSIVYYLSQGDGENLKNVFAFLSPLNVGDAIISHWLGNVHPALLVVKTISTTLFPNFSIENIFPEAGGSDEADSPQDLEAALLEMREVVATAKTEQQLGDEGRVTSLAQRLLGFIFFIGPKDLADLISLPFFMATKRIVSGDGAEEEESGRAVGTLLGLPLVVLTTRLVISRLYPDLLLTDILPDLPFLNFLDPQAAGQKDFEQFSNETMEELRIILKDGNVTNTSGLFQEDAIAGQNVLDLASGLSDFETITVAGFLDDPLITTARLAIAAALASTGAISKLSEINFPSGVDIVVGALGAVGVNVTNTTLPLLERLTSLPLIYIVAEGFPPLKSLLNGFESITKNIVGLILPNAIENMESVFSDNFDGNNFSVGQFVSGVGCRIALTSCSTKNLLAKALGNALREDEMELPEGDPMIDPANETEEADETENLVEEEEKSVNSARDIGSNSMSHSVGFAIQLAMMFTYYLW